MNKVISKLSTPLLFLLILFLPTQLGKHFWPSFSYIYSLRVDYLAPTLYFWDLILIATFLIWLFTKPQINKLALFILLIFLLSQVISLFNAINLGAGLFRFEQLILMSLFALLLSSLNISKVIIPLNFTLIVSIIFESLLSIWQFLFSHSLGLWGLGERTFSLSTPSIATFNFYEQIFLRPYGTFSHPNVLAGFLVITLPLIYLLSKVDETYYRFKTFLSLVYILGFIAAVLSFSRSSLMVLFLESLFFLRKNLIYLIIILLLISPFILIRFNSIFNFDNLSILRREELAQVAWGQFLTNPILGVGLNNFINQIAVSNIVAGPSRFLQPVHNLFLLTMAESGFLGLLGFLTFIYFALNNLWLRRNLFMAKGLLFIWAAILFIGLFDHYFLTLAQGQRLLFLIWGLSMSKSLSFSDKKT